MSPKSNDMVTIEGIGKKYGDHTAVHDLDLSVKEAELYGLIGPDGAGKTTLFRILATLIKPDKGRASVRGLDVVKDYRKLRKQIGYMPGRFSLYTDLSVEENLEFFATIFGVEVKENYELIEEIYKLLEPFKNRRAGDLSGGMKQKLALCCALIHKPRLMILDEPTTGVDPVSRKDFWDILKSLKEFGITILVSTPYMDEAAMCDRIALIQEGRILTKGTPEEIRNEFDLPLFRIKSDQDMYTLLNDLQAYEHTESAFAFGDAVHYTDTREKPDWEDIQQHLSAHDLKIDNIEAGVEDRFMQLMRKQGNGA